MVSEGYSQIDKKAFHRKIKVTPKDEGCARLYIDMGWIYYSRDGWEFYKADVFVQCRTVKWDQMQNYQQRTSKRKK